MKRSLIAVCISILGLTVSQTGGMAAQSMADRSLEKAETGQTLISTKRMSKDALSAVEELDLSEEQQTEIEGIRSEMTDELSEILTDTQMEQFTSAQANGDDMRSVMMGLGLTSSQRSSVISLMRDTQGQIMDVLTPEQRAELEAELPRDRN